MTADDVTGKVSQGNFKSSLRRIFDWFSMNKNGAEKISTVTLISLMRYARPLDILFMCLGSLAGLAHGAVLPIFIYIAGNVVNLFVNRAAHLCPLNLTQIAEDYCPDGVQLDINNFYIHIRKCNLTESNMTVLYSDFKEVASTQTKYFVSIGCAAIVLGYMQASFWNMSAARQTRSIRRHLFRAIMHKEMAYFDTHTTGDLNSRLTESITTIHHGLGDKVGLMIEYIGSCITGFIIGLIKSWQLSLVIISVSPIVFFAVMLYSKVLNRVALMEIKAYERAGAIAEEVFSSIRTVYAYNGQEREKERYVKHLETAKVNGIRKGILTGLTMGFIMLVIRGSFALGFWYGTTLVLDHGYDVGTIITVFFAMFDGLFKLAHAGQYYQSIAEAKVAAHSVWQVIDTPSSIETDTETGIKPDKIIGDIQFDKVHFNYPSRPTIKILNGISFDATHGQTIALVGASGSGKSTCIQLLQRFYDPDSGSIRVDGHAINEYNVRWFRQQIGVVSQESVLFHASIRDNILLGRETATEDELIEAAKTANAHDFIMALPQKYDTLVGERGTALSGGQKQRIAIARALIRDPKILLLDEATSALDNESEKMVQDALMHASQGRTTFIIAHRLSTIRHADQIIVMSKGQIIEEGNHESLMTLEGAYFNLVQQQALQTTDDEDIVEDNDVRRDRAETMMSAVSTLPEPNMTEEDGIQNKEEGPNVTLAMLKLNKPEWLWIIVGCIVCILYGIAQPAFGVVLSKLFSMFQTCDRNQQERDVQIYALVFFCFGIFAFICSFLQYYAFASSGEALTQRLRTKTFEAILRQDMAFFDDPSNNTGSLCTRLSTEASAIRGASGVRIGVLLGNSFSVGAGIVLGFVFSWQLTLAILAFIPFLAIGIFLQNHFMSGASENDRKSQNETSKLTVESMQNIRTVIQLTKEEYFCSKYNELVNVPFRASMKHAHIVGILFSLSESIMHFIGAVIASFGALLIERDEMTFEDCMIVLLCILYGAWHIGATASMAPDYAKAVDAAKKILALFAQQPTIDNQTNQGHEMSKFIGNMELCDVQFSYPSRPDAIVLRKTHLKIDAGQKVAIVGGSGCGKSTIIQLFERFYDPLKGAVLVDGEDIRELDLKWYRSQLGIVLQEPALFDTSIRENIAYGDTSRKDLSMEDIIEVARQANIHDFIQQLPEGYETNCGAKGTQLSGGQKQRIAIARALLRNPKILLLDEATSALDSENERVVQEALDEAQKNRTTITIAHRLSTIQNSDVICVMHRGRIVEMGTHGELMALGGRYYRLVEAKLR